MYQQHKRFIRLTLGLLITYWIVSSFLLNPNYKKIDKSKQQIQYLHAAIDQLYQEEYPPEEDLLIKISEEGESVENNFSQLLKTIHYSPEKEANTSKIAFRGNLQEKSNQLATRANRLGIQFNSNLGFSEQIDAITPRYYDHLNLVNQLLSSFLDLAEQNQSPFSVSQLQHKSLEEVSPAFLNFYQLDIEFTSSLHFAMKAIHLLSQPQQNKKAFFSIEKATFERTSTSSSSPSLIKTTLSLSALSISPQAPIQPQNKDDSSENSSSVPIWKRY